MTLDACAYGPAVARARIRAEAEDFEVEEDLGWLPEGAGSHHWLWVEKVGCNSAWVAERLAAHAGCRSADVGYAGSKDRHARVRQWFSVPALARGWSGWHVPGVSVLAVHRHGRKLQRGCLRGNRFRLVLRAVRGPRVRIEQRLAAIASGGVPNYFGGQRFGHEGGNLRRAEALQQGAHLGRRTRGFALSAARAALFNALLARRVANGSWALGLPGEVWMLDGRRSCFGPEPPSPTLSVRAARGEIHATGPLWGRGQIRVEADLARWEHELRHHYPRYCALLEAAGLVQERRPLRALPREFGWEWLDPETLCLRFALGAGQYATAVLRELVDPEDLMSAPIDAASADSGAG